MPGSERRLSSALVFAAALAWPAGTPATPAWEDAPFLAGAVARAREANRRLLVFVGAAGVREVARGRDDPRRAAAAAGHFWLRYDAGAGEGRDVARRYNVVTFPTLLVIGPDGREMDRIASPLNAVRLSRRLEEIQAGRRTLTELERRLSRRPRDLEARLMLGTALALRGMRRAAVEHLSTVALQDRDNREGLAPRALLVLGKYLWLRSLRRPLAAERALRRLLTLYPDTASANEARVPLARALLARGKVQAALDQVGRELGPAEAHHAAAKFCIREGVALIRGLEAARRAVQLSSGRADYQATLDRLRQLTTGRAPREQ